MENTLKIIALVVQIIGGSLAVIKGLRDFGIIQPGALPLGNPNYALLICIYSYILYDFLDAAFRRLLDRTLVIITASLAFVAFTALVFPRWENILGTAIVAMIASTVALIFKPRRR